MLSLLVVLSWPSIVLVVVTGASELPQPCLQKTTGEVRLYILLCPLIQKPSASWTKERWRWADSFWNPFSAHYKMNSILSRRDIHIFHIALIAASWEPDIGQLTGELCMSSSCCMTFLEMFKPLSDKVCMRNTLFSPTMNPFCKKAVLQCVTLALVPLREKDLISPVSGVNVYCPAPNVDTRQTDT